MEYIVKTRHYGAGKFWNVGDTREAEPADVAPLVQRGALKRPSGKTTKSSDKAD